MFLERLRRGETIQTPGGAFVVCENKLISFLKDSRQKRLDLPSCSSKTGFGSTCWDGKTIPGNVWQEIFPQVLEVLRVDYSRVFKTEKNMVEFHFPPKARFNTCCPYLFFQTKIVSLRFRFSSEWQLQRELVKDNRVLAKKFKRQLARSLL